MKSTLLLLAQVGFIALTVFYFGLLVWEIRIAVNHTLWDDTRKRKFISRIIGSLILWGVFVSIWSLSGIMADFTRFPFNFMPVLAIPLVAVIVLMFSKGVTEVLRHIPPANLIRLQSFRIFVELLLWALFVGSLLPIQMTFEGRNFDILAGLTAPIIAFLVSRKRISKNGLVIWNIICLGLLFNIVTIAILSVPSPLRVFMNEPANTVVTYFPASWLPGFLVPLAYLLHALSLKQLLSVKTKSPAVLNET